MLQFETPFKLSTVDNLKDAPWHETVQKEKEAVQKEE